MESFDNFWNLFDPDPEFNNRRRACYTLWENKSEQQRQAIMQFLQSGKQRSSRNPYYFLADFRVRQPQTMSFNDYYIKYGTSFVVPDVIRRSVFYTRVFCQCNGPIIGPSRDHLPTTKREQSYESNVQEPTGSQKQLAPYQLTENQKLLPPGAVQIISEHYAIEIFAFLGCKSLQIGAVPSLAVYIVGCINQNSHTL